MNEYTCDRCNYPIFKAQSGSFFCAECGAIINSNRYNNIETSSFFYIDENGLMVDSTIRIKDGVITY